jgi:pilus assembly protein Flp/PilA
MKNTIVKLYVMSQCAATALLRNEEGQDLIEYALVAALIGFAAVAGMGKLANSINVAFSTIGTTLSATA